MPYFSIAMRSMPNPKAKPCHASGFDAAGLQHLGVDHAGAEDLEPVVAFADLERAALPRAADVDLAEGSVNGKVRGAEAQFDVVDLENAFTNSSSTHFRFAMEMSRSIASPSTWWNIGVCVWS